MGHDSALLGKGTIEATKNETCCRKPDVAHREPVVLIFICASFISVVTHKCVDDTSLHCSFASLFFTLQSVNTLSSRLHPRDPTRPSQYPSYYKYSTIKTTEFKKASAIWTKNEGSIRAEDDDVGPKVFLKGKKVPVVFVSISLTFSNLVDFESMSNGKTPTRINSDY